MSTTTTYIHVNSANRDTSTYPSGNTYTMYLPNPIKNVTQVEVIVARIPNTLFNITSTVPQININDILYQIPTGFYSDPYTIATAVHQLLPSGLDFDWLPAEGKFIFFSNTNTDYITILTDDMATITGFTKDVQYTVTAVASPVFSSLGFKYYAKSPTIGDMTKNDFIFLDIPELSHRKFQDACSGPYNSLNATGLFTGIPMDVAPNTVKLFKNNDYPISVSFDPPISQVAKLSISWYDKNRKLVNFQGMEDNAVILRFTTPIIPPQELGDGTWDDVEIKREILPPPPKPKMVKEKKTWGKWILVLFVSALVALWAMKKRGA
jgi:hypothetical protein